MNETIKKLTEEARAKIAAAFATKEFSEVADKTKAAGDDAGSFKFVVSTSDFDRQGESIDQRGWDLTFYKMNPVVLWAHDYSSLPIGMCTSIEVRDGKLVAEGKFAPADANPFAQQVRKLYDLGMVNATSVGFIPKEFDSEKSGVIAKSELLEFSLVPVPANAQALRLSKEQVRTLSIDTAMLLTKGMKVEVKDDAAEPKIPEDKKPEEPAAEKAGEVAAQVDAIEAREQKWQNYMAVCEVMDAFCSVYFADETPVGDFAKLFSETIDILKNLTAAPISADDEKKVEEATAKLLGGAKHLSIKQSMLAIFRNHVALGSLELSEGGKAGKGKESPKPDGKAAEGLAALNDFVESREILRSVDKALEKVLHNFNSAARNRKPETK